MIIEEKDFVDENKEEEKLYLKLAEDFTKEAKSQNSKYWIKFRRSSLNPYLMKKGVFGFGTSIPPQAIFWYKFDGGYFSFAEGIGKDTYQEIKKIINKIPEKFKIEVVKDG